MCGFWWAAGCQQDWSRRKHNLKQNRTITHVWPPMYTYRCIPVYIHVCLFACLPACLAVCLSACLCAVSAHAFTQIHILHMINHIGKSMHNWYPPCVVLVEDPDGLWLDPVHLCTSGSGLVWCWQVEPPGLVVL
jgi:hypothetical protein